MKPLNSNSDIKEAILHQRLIALAGVLYGIWWYAAKVLFPEAFNPTASRVVVLLLIFSALVLSFLSERVLKRAELLFTASVWLITLHFFYLVLGNRDDTNWMMGAYIVVIAASMALFSTTSLLLYSIYSLVLALVIVVSTPGFQSWFFFLGLVTILVQSNIGLRSRLSLIKNLSASNDRFQSLFNATFEGIFVHQKGRIVNVNSALTEMFRYSQRELIGSDPTELLHPERRAVTTERYKQQINEPYETLGISKDKQAIDVELRGKDFNYDNAPARIVAVRDIGDRKRAEKERILALTLAENVRLRDDFISIASHELKTPLSSLQLQLLLIERELKKAGSDEQLPDKMRDSLHFLKRQAERLTELIETMLDVSRISAGRFYVELQKTDFSSLIKDSVHTLQMTPSDIKPVFHLHIPDQVVLEGDPQRLQQVIENLLSNALKYGQGSPITLHLEKTDTHLRFSVEDKGIGIAPEFLDRIFERFERALSARNITGFGLGLYIVREIVSAHHGSIRVESRLGEGSQFIVTLPLRAPPHPTATV